MLGCIIAIVLYVVWALNMSIDRCVPQAIQRPARAVRWRQQRLLSGTASLMELGARHVMPAADPWASWDVLRFLPQGGGQISGDSCAPACRLSLRSSRSSLLLPVASAHVARASCDLRVGPPGAGRSPLRATPAWSSLAPAPEYHTRWGGCGPWTTCTDASATLRLVNARSPSCETCPTFRGCGVRATLEES